MFGVRLKLFILLIIAAHAAVFDARAALAPDEPEPRPTITEAYHHVAFTAKEGAPSGIWTIAQSTDGWLWLGCATGVYRFDGVSFERVELLPANSVESRSVRSVMASADGGLWVVMASGRTAYLSDPIQPQPRWLTGLPAGERIDRMDEDASGDFWAFTATNKAFLVDGSTLHPPGAAWRYPEGEVKGVLIDSDGDYWVRTAKALGVLRKGSKVFEGTQVTDWPYDAELHTSQRGQLWFNTETHYGLVASSTIAKGPFGGPWRRNADGGSLLTRDGSWWTVDCPTGVCRGWPANLGAQLPLKQFESDAFTHRDGLSSDGAMILFEDMKGNIWVGTKLGLDEFHKNSLTTVRFPTSVRYFVMAVDPQSGIWTGSNTTLSGVENSLWRIDPHPVQTPEFSGSLGAVFKDTDGSYLWGGVDAIWRLQAGQVRRLPIAAPFPKGSVRTLQRDSSGDLWASFLGNRTYKLDPSGWTLNGGLAQAHDAMATSVAKDEDGALWFGYRDNAVARLQGTQLRTYTQLDGLDVGPVTSIWMGTPKLFGGEFGIDMFIDGRFIAIRSDQPDRLKGISGIVRARDGDLWLNGRAGGARISSGDFEHAVHDPTFRMPLTVYDSEDGLPAGAAQAIGSPSVVEDKQGKLWFATEDGLAWLQPTEKGATATQPKVEILSLSAPHAMYPPTSGLELPAGTRNLSIRYTALQVTFPTRTRFRFRLSGIDNQWRDMGAERSANYSNLSPGSYQVQVLASNEAGMWNEIPAELRFSIRAAFYQTTWFNVACGVVFLMTLLGIARILSTRAASRAAARMGERMLERERIARELHDTLLQDVQALRLNLRALHMKYGDDNPMGPELAALDRAAEHSVAQARSRVSGLRSGEITHLGDQLREFGEQLAALYPATLEVESSGSEKRLHPVAADEIVSIGREALLNAFRHAQAKQIWVSIKYSNQALHVTISDDGIGVDGDRRGTPSAGHFGIVGMRERARGLKADLLIHTNGDRGTQVLLRVPAATAFARS